MIMATTEWPVACVFDAEGIEKPALGDSARTAETLALNPKQ